MSMPHPSQGLPAHRPHSRADDDAGSMTLVKVTAGLYWYGGTLHVLKMRLCIVFDRWHSESRELVGNGIYQVCTDNGRDTHLIMMKLLCIQ